MKNFQFKRFWQVLKRTILSERRRLVAYALGTAGFILLIQLAFTFSLTNPTASANSMQAFMGTALSFTALNYVCYFFASGICGDVRKTHQRTTTLMLPASRLEKYTARLVYCAVIIPLMCLLCLLAAIGLRMLLELLAGHSVIDSGLDVFKLTSLGSGTVTNFLSFVWSMSLFVLGGTFFRKLPFVWTAGVMMMLSILLGIVLAAVMMANPANIDSTMTSFIHLSTSWYTGLFYALFAVFNIWLSYRLYRRLQVVQNNWFNV